MKPYQFYVVRRFPKLKSGENVKNQIQMTFFGEDEDVETSLTLENPSFEGSLGLIRVKSEIKHRTYGFIKAVINHERRKFDFTEYLEPVDFPAYYDESRELMLFQAPKKVCKGVLANLREKPCGVDLIEMEVDFGQVLELCSEYQGAWFRSVSSRVRSAGISGDQIQDDALFKKLLKDGILSNVTIPWMQEDAEHRVMITGSGAIVLVQDYKNNLGLELRLVNDVYEQLLCKVWEEKKGRRSSDSSPGEP